MAEDKLRRGPANVRTPLKRPKGDQDRPGDGTGGASDIDYDPTIAGPDVREDRKRRRREPSAEEVERAREIADLVVGEGGRKRT